MMKKIAFLCTMTTIVLVMVSPLVSVASESADVSVTIVSGITFSCPSSLEFGSIISSNESGTVTISSGGMRNSTGGTELAGGTYSAASFSVTGESGYAYSVTLSANETVQVSNEGTNSMTLTDFICSNSSPTIQSDGTSSFNVGATLEVPPNSPSGTYTGTFTVTVQYE